MLMIIVRLLSSFFGLKLSYVTNSFKKLCHIRFGPETSGFKVFSEVYFLTVVSLISIDISLFQLLSYMNTVQ